MTEVNEESSTASNGIQMSADVDPRAWIGRRVRVWHLAQVREEAVVGDGCQIGRGAYVGPGVVMGRNCKLQNHALVYEPARLADGVFVGPAAVLTNDEFPRAVTPDGALKRHDDWVRVGVTVGTGAAIGARAVCVAPLVIGAWAMIAAGAVVTRDVPDYAVVAGVPARRLGWVGEAGRRLEAVGLDGPQASTGATAPGGLWRCPATGQLYRETEARLEKLETRS
ncbi:acyltransferase [Citricoccus parietis]|uniref:Acyltransferase n=2 Tax=Citricoccus parietis TaxID=592307 RepID=A0ABV5G6X5_9MICC